MSMYGDSSESLVTPPVVNVIKTEDEPQPSESGRTAPSRGVERRLARGFTITVSAPPDEGFFDESLSNQESIGGESTLSDTAMGKRRFWEPDHLAPEEYTPEVPLDKTESRLPSLEDMLADDEIRKMLRTSEHHREIQEAIMIEDEAEKYEQMMCLVQKSYEDAQWRITAAKDTNLIDTCVLFIRQRVTEAQNPFQAQGGDFMGRSTKTLKSLNSRQLGRSNSRSSDTGSQSPGGQSYSRMISMADGEVIQRAAVVLALAGPAMKLLRNFCVGNRACQLYLHDHRILTLLLDHIDLISEITYQATETGLEEREPKPALVIPSRRCPTWAALELLGFPRSLVQLVTNVVTGNPHIQAHILEHIFPEAFVKVIVLSGDADLLSCLLHCLTVQQLTSKVFDLLIADSRSLQIWYLLLSAAFRQAEPTLESIAYRRQATTPTAQDSLQGEWLSLFLSSMLRRECEGKSFFVHIVNRLMASDVMSFRSIVPKMVLSHNAPTRSPSRSVSHSRRSSYELTSEWQGHVLFQVDKVLVSSKPDVMLFLFTLIEALLDGEVAQPPFKQDTLSASLINSSEVLDFLLNHFLTSIKALESNDLNDTAALTYRQCFIPFVQILGSLTALAPCLLNQDQRQQFNHHLGSPLLTAVTRFLDSLYVTKHTDVPRWEVLEPTISRRDLLLILANLCYQSPENQKQFAAENGILMLLKHAHMDEKDPLMEQAAIFGLRNSCQGENQQLLQDLLRGEFKRVQNVSDKVMGKQSVVIGRFNGNDTIVKIDEIYS